MGASEDAFPRFASLLMRKSGIEKSNHRFFLTASKHRSIKRRRNMEKFSRRQFLGCSAAALGAACLGCGGTACLAAATPRVEKFETTISGEDIMKGKVLVAYATKCGSTGEIAKAIAEQLAARGFPADVKPAENVAELSGYSAVVLGSAVRFGQWLAPAADFAARFKEPLNKMPVAIFTAHIMALGETEQDRTSREAYIPPAVKEIQPASTAFFAGCVDPEKLSFVEKTIGRIVGSPEGDRRDWTKIRAWAAELFM
jgi:menaquinone-dependent protoporphyrinogen oxidase